MTAKKSKFIRLIALVLCFTVLLSQPLTAQAVVVAETEEAEIPLALDETTEPSAPADWLMRIWDFFWRTFGLLSYRLKPEEGYAYNTKYAFQWLFGFNVVYDALSIFAGCFYDTIRCKFSYEGRDWMVQLWKGAYLFDLCTGGEIGFYSKASWLPAEHYQGAVKSDWIGMEFSIYHNQDKLFTRPMEDNWWATGYKFHILTAALNSPRMNCTMDATLRFQNEEMAALFAQALAEKGFSDEDLPFDTYHTEHYTLEGNSVRLMWKGMTEGFY